MVTEPSLSKSALGSWGPGWPKVLRRIVKSWALEVLLSLASPALCVPISALVRLFVLPPKIRVPEVARCRMPLKRQLYVPGGRRSVVAVK